MILTVADAFVVLYDAIVDGISPALAHGREGYYFTENGEHTYYDLTKAIGSALVKLGKATSSGPTTFTEDEIKKLFGGVRTLFMVLIIQLIFCSPPSFIGMGPIHEVLPIAPRHSGGILRKQLKIC